MRLRAALVALALACSTPPPHESPRDPAALPPTDGCALVDRPPAKRMRFDEDPQGRMLGMLLELDGGQRLKLEKLD